MQQVVKWKRGRQVGSRAKHVTAAEEGKIIVHLDVDVEEPLSRGKIYNAIEAVQLAKVWVE